MKCSRLEKWIALYVEGDLSRRKARRVEAHLAACDACRGLAEDLAASQAAFRSLGTEPLGAAVFDELRRGVLGRIGGETARPKRRWLWAGALASAATAAVLVGVLATRPEAPPAPPRPEVARVIEPALPVAPPPRPARPVIRRRAAPKPVVRPVKTEPLVVKLETADPNVIIYWIVDSTGDSE